MWHFTVITAPQRSPEWFRARLGRLTASCASDVVATIKGGKPTAGRQNLLTQIVVERLTGEPDDAEPYVNGAMQWGVLCEPLAYNAYEALTGTIAQRVGFLAHTTLPIGCSPDGILDDFAGGLELKCPQKATHYGYVRGPQEVPAKYLPQIYHSLWVTDARYWDFLSFHPAFPPELQTFYVRVERAAVERALAVYIDAAKAFLQDVERELAEVRRGRTPAQGAA